MPCPLWWCSCHQPSFSPPCTDKTDYWGGTEWEWGILGRTLVTLSSKKSCTFTSSHWAAWAGGDWRARKGFRADLPLHADASGVCGVWRSAWGCLVWRTAQGQIPAGAWVETPCHRVRVSGGAFSWGWSDNAYGCAQGPGAFLLCQERNFPSTFKSCLPILHCLSSSLSIFAGFSIFRICVWSCFLYMLANKHMEQPNKPMLLLISLPAGRYNELPNKLFASNILRLML